MECSLSTSRQGSPISQNIGKDCKQRLSSVTLYLPCHLHDFHDWSFNNCREVVKILITFITPIIVLQNLPLSLSTWSCHQTENKIILFTIFKTVYKFLGLCQSDQLSERSEARSVNIKTIKLYCISFFLCIRFALALLELPRKTSEKLVVRVNKKCNLKE